MSRFGLLIVAVLLSLVPAISGRAAEPPSGTFLPAVINIYKNAGITADDAKKAVEEANKILKQANMTLVVVKVNENVTEGDDGEDGLVDWDTREFDKITEAGKKEIEKTPNKKGIKLSFMKEPQKGVANPGWAWHRQPVVCCKNRGSAAATGSTIAHEVGHIMTLSSGHKIDNTTNANAAGHAPDAPGNTGRGNLMAPSDYRSGTHLTPDQIREMQTQRFIRGKCSTQFRAAYPAEKEKQQHGAKTDPLRDSVGAFGYSDLADVILSSRADDNMLDGVLTLGDAFSGTVNNTFYLTIDSALGGVPYMGFTDVDYAVEMQVSGSGGVYAATGVVRDLVGGGAIPFAPILATSDLFQDSDGPPFAQMSQLLFSVDKNLIGMGSLGAGLVPIGIVSAEGSLIADTDVAAFDLQKWLSDPTLITSGDGVPVPGSPYAFSVAGLTPYDPLKVYLNDQLVYEGFLDASGETTGSFVFPMTLSPTETHFLFAQDASGEFGYTITCPDPATAFLMLGAGFGLGLRRRPGSGRRSAV